MRHTICRPTVTSIWSVTSALKKIVSQAMRIVTFHIHACVHSWRGVEDGAVKRACAARQGGGGNTLPLLRAPGSWRPTPPQPQIKTYAPFYTVMHSCRGGRCYGAGDPDTRRQAGGGGDAPAIPCAPGFRHPPPPLSLRASDPNMCKAGRGEGRAAPPRTPPHTVKILARIYC